MQQVSQFAGRRIRKDLFFKMLKVTFPEEQWDWTLFSRRSKKSRQWWLIKKIEEIFPNEVINEDYKIKWYAGGKKRMMELDVFLPALNVAFEYQGEQHYHDLTKAGFLPLELRKSLDMEKSSMCPKLGIKLISIPYWWDNKVNSLKATILKEHPELSHKMDNPSYDDKIGTAIPPQPPDLVQKNLKVMLPNVWSEEIDPSGYWMSEKYDGIRAFWDGGGLYTKSGNLLNPPKWWLSQLS